MTSPRRFFVVGTDTGVGKTRVSAALVRALRARGHRVVAFKPAITGPTGDDDDLEQLRGAMSPIPGRAEIHTFAYPEPLAPGVAQDPRAFTHGEASPEQRASAYAKGIKTLCSLEARYAAQITIIEGAGGLRVPMPGGTWLDAWIEAMRADAIVVGRVGLGTLNHTLLTFEALDRRRIKCAGFVLSATVAQPDPSAEANLQILEHTSRRRCLGVLPHHALGEPPDHTWLTVPNFADPQGA